MTTRLTRGMAVATASAIAALGLSAAAANAAVTVAVDGTNVTLTSDAASDRVNLGVIGDAVVAGNLAITHNLPGFNSNKDWDAVTPLDQPLPANATISVVFTGGDGDDAIAAAAAGLAKLTADGGNGNDSIIGSNRPDELNGGAGDDRITPSPGDDAVVKGGDGNDLFIWNNGDGTDTVDGENGADQQDVSGDPTQGDEFTIKPLNNRAQFDRINLGTFGISMGTVERLSMNTFGGDDKITGENGAGIALLMDGGPGNDSLTGAEGRDIINGGDGNDTLTGGGQDDRITGDRGADNMVGGDGDDTMVWNNGDGSDKADGDAGYDTVEVNGGTGSPGDQFTVKPNGARAQFDRVTPGPFAIDIAAEVLDLNALGGDDSFVASDNTPLVMDIDGGSGNDTLTGANGNDSLLGASGNDTLTGGAGLDALDGAEGDDRILARDGAADLLRCGAGTDSVQVDAPPIDAGVACESADAPPVVTPPAAKKPTIGNASTPRGRRVTIRVTCPAGGTVCTGDAQLFTASAVRVGRVRAILALGPARRFSLQPGQSRSIAITLPANYPSLGRNGRLRVRAVVRSDQTGVSTKALTLRVPALSGLARAVASARRRGQLRAVRAAAAQARGPAACGVLERRIDLPLRREPVGQGRGERVSGAVGVDRLARARQGRGRPGSARPVVAGPAAALATAGEHDPAWRRVDRAGLDLLVGIAGAGHERVEFHSCGEQRLAGPDRRHQHRRRPGGPQRGVVAAGEVDAVAAREHVPWERIAPRRYEPVAEHRDRSLGGVVEVGERPPLLGRAPRGVQVDPARAQLGDGAIAERIGADGGKEHAGAGDPRELHGGHAATAGRGVEMLVRMHDRARRGQLMDGCERDPLDMADDGEAHGRSLCG